MSKISELSDGGSLVSSDYLIAVRSGGNVKVRMDQINVDQVDLGDNEFIRLGNSQDLTMVHNATQSIINQAGIGDLLIQKAGSTKLTINASGIDVTGSVTADGLTVANTSVVAGDFDGGTAATYIRLQDDTDNFLFGSNNSLGNFLIKNETADALRLSVANTGDISFYEDTGTTPKLFWDASAESLGIGTTDPSTYGGLALQQSSDTSSKGLAIVDSTAAQSVKLWVDGTNSYLSSGNTGADPLVLNLGGGNVGIGTNLPDTLLHLSDVTGGAVIRLERNDSTIVSTDVYGEIQFEGQDASAGSAAGIRGKILGVSEGATGEMALAFQTASGYSSSTERMRIDASGNLLVGTSAPRGVGATIYNPTGVGRIDLNKSVSGAATAMGFYYNGSQVGSITYTDTSTSFNTSSDQRLKENIADAPSASDDIDAIQVRSFDWKADGSHQKYGMVAQELQSVAPSAVSQPEDPEEMMGVDYSKLVPMLVKEIQSLRARVAQLES